MRLACVRVGRVVAALLFCAAISGCASSGEAVEKQLSKLHDDITRLQSQTDRLAERLEAMEHRQTAAVRASERASAVASSPVVSRPKLKVVRMEPDAEPTAASGTETTAEADTGPRVLIQGEGKTLESRTLPAKAPAKSSGAPATKAAPAP